MKRLGIFSVAILISSAAAAQYWTIGANLALSHPTGGMSTTMNNAFGVSFNLSHHLKSPFAVGVEAGFAGYGSQTTRQAYTFDDGSVTETDVVVNNGFFNLQLTGRYFLRDGKAFNPYVAGRLGWAFFSTNLRIEDPEDEFSCHPIESDMLHRDDTYMAGVGGGMRIDFGAIFKNARPGRLYLDAAVNVIQGGTASYMNSEVSGPQPRKSHDVSARFLNTQTQVIHQHHVGYVYTSLVSMIEYRLGIICKADWQ